MLLACVAALCMALKPPPELACGLGCRDEGEPD